MIIETVLPIDPNTVTSISKTKQEPEWMTNLRVQAIEAAGQLELPVLEKTSLRRWELSAYGQYTQVDEVASIAELPQSLATFLEEFDSGSDLVVQNNSSVTFKRIVHSLKQQGVIFTDLETAVREHSDLVEQYFMKAVDISENKLTALHTALWNGGVFLYVPRNTHVELPLQAVFYTDDADSTFAPHVVIVAEENSSVTYVDNYFSNEANSPLVHNGIVEVFVKQNAEVNYSSVHHFEDHVTDITYRRAIVERDGQVSWTIGEMIHGNAVSDTSSVLKGDGSHSQANVVSVGTKKQKLNVTTRAVHFGKSSTSEMTTRAVMRDESTAIYNGVTKIEKGATNANGEQAERILMLSPKARGDANPILLIDEDEVTAGHAASVGQVNPEHVYYLMSRGISRADAERLIIRGFLAPIVADIPLEHVVKLLEGAIERKIEQ